MCAVKDPIPLSFIERAYPKVDQGSFLTEHWGLWDLVETSLLSQDRTDMVRK